jgi:hypothetical protein
MKQHLLLASAMLVACAAPARHDPQPRETPRAPDFVDRVWVSTEAASAPGTLRVFLRDGTLVMDSCWETYRLARWRRLDDQRIEWSEDGAPIEARVTRLTDEAFHLRLELRGGAKEEAYRPAVVPTVCPDMPR